MSSVIVAASPGISNKIKSYCSLLRKYDSIKTTKHSDAYLFENIEVATEEDFEKCQLIDNQKFINNDMWRFKIYDEDVEYLENYKTIDLLYENTPQYFVNKYNEAILRLQINSEILKYVNSFAENWDNMIGVHIRSWYCDKRKFHSNKVFEDQIDRLNPEKFFFCSDNSDVQKYFMDKYHGRIITYDRQLYNSVNFAESGHHDDIQITTDAFIELLILSKCSIIVGTYASTFDEIAWWFSGCKSKVIIPQPMNFDEQFHNSIFLK
jgi:hypothetical protein